MVPVPRLEVRQGGRQAMQRAPAVLEPLGVVSLDRERVGNPLVGYEHGAVLAAQRPHGAQRTNRIAHVVDGLERTHEVKAATKARICGVPLLEDDPIGDAASLSVGSCLGNRRLVEVESHNLDSLEAKGDGDTGPACATAHVGDAGRGGGLESLHQAGDLREPVRGEQVDEHRTVDARDEEPDVRTVGIEGDATAAAERVKDLWQGLRKRDDSRPEWREER
ncbi:MAG: hypothetical protein QOD01_2220 [Actinomycetota bacterium]|nr:hypothetical protein [Actinomycetota bacterium]